MIEDMLPTVCGNCGGDKMEVWPYPAKNPVLISSGQMMKTCIPVLVCTCGTANYPDVTPHGLFPVHNKCLITVDFLVEIRNFISSAYYCILQRTYTVSFVQAHL